MLHDGRAQAVAAIVAGDGVLPAGTDVDLRTALLAEGKRISRVSAAVLAAAGIARVWVRDPGVRIVKARPAPDPVIDAARDLVARAVAAHGG